MAPCSVGSPSDREQLIRQCLPDVRARAWELAPRHRDVPIEDLISAGHLGLVQAAVRWDPAGGASFRGFAYVRIRGAMLDYLRRNGVSRHDLRRASDVERARFAFAAREGRFPSGAELADELGCTVREVTACEQRMLTAKPSSLEDGVPGPLSGEPSRLEDLIPADVDIERDVCDADTAREVRRLVDLLPARERQVIRWAYWDHRNLREIADVLGVTESRVCQMRQTALKHLRQLAPADMAEAA